MNKNACDTQNTQIKCEKSKTKTPETKVTEQATSIHSFCTSASEYLSKISIFNFSTEEKRRKYRKKNAWNKRVTQIKLENSKTKTKGMCMFHTPSSKEFHDLSN
jgi:hypothetical protein